ncbi:hypothetical protein ACHAW6_011895 [Cyclotella cf. meneghiniana]
MDIEQDLIMVVTNETVDNDDEESITNTALIADVAKTIDSTCQTDEDVVRALPPHAAPTPRSSGAHISNPNADVEANQASLGKEQESTVAAASTVGAATGASVANGAAAASAISTTGPTTAAESTATSAGPTATNASLASVTAAPSTNAQEPWNPSKSNASNAASTTTSHPPYHNPNGHHGQTANPYHYHHNNVYHHHHPAYSHHHPHWPNVAHGPPPHQAGAQWNRHHHPGQQPPPPPHPLHGNPYHHHGYYQGGPRYPHHLQYHHGQGYHPNMAPNSGATTSHPTHVTSSSHGGKDGDEKNISAKASSSTAAHSNDDDKIKVGSAADSNNGVEKDNSKPTDPSAIPSSSSWASQSTSQTAYHPPHPAHHHPYGTAPWRPPPPGYQYPGVPSSASYGSHGAPPHGAYGYPHGYGIHPPQGHRPYPHHNSNISWTNSSTSASTADATKQVRNEGKKHQKSSGVEYGNKKRGRDEREGRDDGPSLEDGRDLTRSYTDDTASTLSVGGLSMTSLEQPKASSPKRRKGLIRNQNIHRDFTADIQDFPHLDNPSTLSEGKMILQNLSINSLGSLRQSYSAEIAELCGPSPIHVAKMTKGSQGGRFDEGKTPKKRNTSCKKITKDSASLVFRLDNSSTTPAAIRCQSQDEDSPNMMDLIDGADTPTAGLLLSSMENVMLDESSLNRNMRGQAFTPLPHILGGDDVNFAITPNLSWSINGSPLGSSFEKLTPRFGLDSTKSKKNPLASPKSFWKDDFLEEHHQKKNSIEKGKSEMRSILSMLSPAMREMDAIDPSLDGGPTSPIPIQRKLQREAPKSSLDPSITTPLRRPPTHVSSSTQPIPRPHHSSPWRANYRGPPAYMHSPIPTHHSHHPHHAMSPYDGRYGEHRREGPPSYGMYPPPHHGHYNPDDRIRHLRGRGPPLHQMPPQHHLPPPSYHHFSPLTNVVPRGRGGWHENQMSNPMDISASKRKCVPLRPPVPAKFQGDIEKYKDAQVPEFNNLVNFPCHMNQKQAPNIPEGMRCCVMCGQACPCSQGGKQKKGDTGSKSGGTGSSVAPLGSSNQVLGNKNPSNLSNGSGFAIIPTQNKGLCTLCDVNVWIVTQTGLEIKWCKGCKNFRPWAAFGDKGLATKCVRCRDRQREKYALQKEEKERARGSSKSVTGSMPPMGMGPI